MSMAVAGATVGVGDFLGVETGSAAQASQSTGLDALFSDPAALLTEVGKNVQAHAVQVGVSTGMQVITGEMKWKEALKQGAINVAANTAAALGANWLGKLYKSGDGSLSYVEHKLGHFFNEGFVGACSNFRDPLNGFLTGGCAGVGTEMMAEWLPSSMSMQGRSDVVRLTAGVGAFFLGGDVNVAAMAASNAFENNFAMSGAAQAAPLIGGAGAAVAAAAPPVAAALGAAVAIVGAHELIKECEHNEELASLLGEDENTGSENVRRLRALALASASRSHTPKSPLAAYGTRPIILSTPFAERLILD